MQMQVFHQGVSSYMRARWTSSLRPYSFDQSSLDYKPKYTGPNKQIYWPNIAFIYAT
ncbi:hypothetical protein Hanom_Chr04g00346411 [Helianthus anomalus]